jgi:hypothetical protein
MLITTEHDVYFISSYLSVKDQLKELYRINERENKFYCVPLFTNEEAEEAYQEYLEVLDNAKARV